MKNVGKLLKQHILLLVIGSALGLGALLFVFGIPVGRMQAHVWQSMPMIEQEFGNEEVIAGYPASAKGNFTDCLMLGTAVYNAKDHTLLERALYMYRGESGTGTGWAPGISLKDYLLGQEQHREMEYSRYWHGYLVVLKPLLYFMNFNAIRVLASVVQVLLVGWIMMLCGKRGESFLGTGLCVSLAFLYFPLLYYSLSLSTCYYLMSLAVLIQLKWNEKLVSRNWYGAFFFIIGMATAYFDLLTYPLVTLGFPICVYLYLNSEQWKDGLKSLVCYSLEWCGGYAGLWAMKWILTDVLTGGSTIADALNTILTRTDNAAGQSRLSGFAVVLSKNLSPYTNWVFALIIAVSAIVLLTLLLRKRKQWMGQNRWQAAGVILAVSLMPFVWFLFTQNHSEEHWMFTCKIVSVSFFALLCAVGKVVRDKSV